MKKIGIIILFILIFLTGCSNYNSSPDKLAEEMVKRLSKGDYKNIEELILVEQNTFITPNGFKQYLKENDVFIEGNELVEVVNYTEPSEYEQYKKVIVRIDDNKTIEISTQKKGDKWFVDLGENKYKTLEFLAPVDASVKLDGKELDYTRYSKKVNNNIDLSYTWKMATPYMNDFTVKVLGNSNYSLEVDKKGFDKYKTKINSTTTGKENVGVRSSNQKYMIVLQASNNEKEKIKNFVKEYYEGLFSSIDNNGTINDLEKYISKEYFGEFKKDFEKKYNNRIKILKKENSYSREIYEQYAFDNIEYFEDGIYYLDDQNIFVGGTLSYKFHYKFEYFGMMASSAERFNEDKTVTEDINVGILLVKENDGYKIKTGGNLIP